MSSDDLDLREISRSTLGYYGASAVDFWEGTRDHDVSQNYEAFMGALDGPGPHRVLDLGCGPGRDLRYFREAGLEAVGLDGCSEFVRMARDFSGCEVLLQDFLFLDLAARTFDGIFANATLQHVPSAELSRVLGELARALRPGGVLFLSVPRGANQEGFHGDRYSFFANLDTWRTHLASAGLQELGHYYRPPGKPRDQQPWLAMTWSLQ
jgi:SAM-dependent methyltransferase